MVKTLTSDPSRGFVCVCVCGINCTRQPHKHTSKRGHAHQHEPATLPDPLVPQCSAYHHGNDTRPPRWTGEACRHVGGLPARAHKGSIRVQPGNPADSNSLSANWFLESVCIQIQAARGLHPSRMPCSKPGRQSRQITWSDRAPPALLGPGSASRQTISPPCVRC